MCSRFRLKTAGDALARHFGLTVPPPHPMIPWPQDRTCHPTDVILTIAVDGSPLPCQWGLAVDWDSKPVINARAETLTSRPTFRRLLDNPVLIPASAWWEWRVDHLGRRVRVCLNPRHHPLFAFAGLRDGDRTVIVTRSALPAIAHVHTRMPVVLTADDHRPWLDQTRLPEMDSLEMNSQDDQPPPRQGDLFG